MKTVTAPTVGELIKALDQLIQKGDLKPDDQWWGFDDESIYFATSAIDSVFAARNLEVTPTKPEDSV